MRYIVAANNGLTIIPSAQVKYSDEVISEIFDDLFIPHSPIIIESKEDVKILLDTIGCSNHAYYFKLTDEEYEKIFKNSDFL